MNINAITPSAPETASMAKTAQSTEKDRREPAFQDAPVPENSGIQPEEVLNKIKGLTENGMYSVRFEMDDRNNSLVIFLVDQKSGDVIRQIPPNELMNVTDKLQKLSGNLFNSTM